MKTYVVHVDNVKEYSELKVPADNKTQAELLLKTYTIGGQPLVKDNQWKFVHEIKEEN